MRRRLPLTAAPILLAVLLASCAADPGRTTAPPGASTNPGAGAGTSEPGTTAPADPTCETLVSPGTVEALTDAGWSAQEREFRIGELVLEGGLQCVWGDDAVASDHVQLYGWAPIDAETAAAAQQQLLDQGWLREEGADGTYLTEDPDYAMGTDDDGYGMTYLFGDGWVTMSDTKQGLLLIERP